MRAERVMLQSKIHTFVHKDRTIQKVQCVTADASDLHFFKTQPSEKAFEQVVSLYQNFIVPRYSALFGTLILFRLPEDMPVPFSSFSEEYGEVFDPLSVVTVQFQKYLSLRGGEVVFDDTATKEFFDLLESRGCLKIARGKRNYIRLLPVSSSLGFLTESETESSVRINSHFFVMDVFDVATVFDHIGCPVGAMVEKEEVLSPPLFDREVLEIQADGSSRITGYSLFDTEVILDGKCYQHENNAVFYSRPKHKVTEEGGYDYVIVNGSVVAEKADGKSVVPASGFVMKVQEKLSLHSFSVSYGKKKGVRFAVQVGNSAVINGKATTKFLSPFWHLTQPWIPSYPPSMYPHRYGKDRAPRTVLGTNQKGQIMLLWMEGAGKFGYDPKKDSSGATLKEAAEYAVYLGMVNGVHLDGGGSAQILYQGKRELMLSDRDPIDYREIERAVPVGISLK